MTVVVNHSTPADATFSATGATAWNANHTLSGVGTMAEQNANAVAITGGTINGATVGVTTPAAGAFTTLAASSTTTLSGLTASTALALDASKNVVSVANTGTGSNVLATSPTLITPALGTPSAAVLTNATGLPLTTGVTGILPVANGGSGTATPAIVAGTNITVSGTWPNQTINSVAGGSGTVTSVAATVPAFLSVTGSPITTSGTLAIGLSGSALPIANGGTGSTTSTGSGSVVLATSPTLVTPALGTPSALVGTNITGTASGLTAGNVTTNANLTGVVTSIGNATSFASSTGSGAVVLATSPTLVTPALGTPSALVGTNITGTASGLTAGSVTTNANLTGVVTSVGNATSLGSFTSAQLAGALTDETGTGASVFATSPTLVTPALGTPASGVMTNVTGLPLSTGVTGNLPVTNLNSGTSASSTTFWRGDATWATPSGGGSSTLTISNKTAAYTVVAGDLGTVINCTSGTFTVSLTAAATLGAGFNVQIWNTSTTNTDLITIDPASTELVDGNTTIAIYPGNTVQLVCTGTAWETSIKLATRMLAANTASISTPPVASGSIAIALGLLSAASGTRSLALGVGTLASGTGSGAIGTNSSQQGAQAVTASGAMALGGSYASGTDSFAAATTNNTSTYGATAANAIAIGQQAKATVASAVAIGAQTQATGVGGYCLAIGYQSQATAPGAIAIGNQYNVTTTVASGSSAIAIGDGVKAQAQYSIALGAAANSVEYGKYSVASGFFAAVGDNQTGGMTLRRATTDATATVLTSSGAAAATTNQLILPNSSAYTFTGTIVARQQAAGGTASAAWKIEGLIRREANAASTTLVASAVNTISNVPGWVIAITADTTNGGLAITATGAAATNIRWVATLHTSEVTYA